MKDLTVLVATTALVLALGSGTPVAAGGGVSSVVGGGPTTGSFPDGKGAISNQAREVNAGVGNGGDDSVEEGERFDRDPGFSGCTCGELSDVNQAGKNEDRPQSRASGNRQ